MQIIERIAETDEAYAKAVSERGRGLFRSKETRDRVTSKLKQYGYTAKRSVVSNQQLHPEYVTDYVGTLELGFGNTQYQMFWSKLYSIDITGSR